MKIFGFILRLAGALALGAGSLCAQTVGTAADLASAITTAISKPTATSTITLSSGTYSLTTDLPTIAVDNLTLKGPTSGSPAIIDASGLASGVILNVVGNNLTLLNIQFANAKTHAITIRSGSVTGLIQDCSFTNSTPTATAAIDGCGCQDWTITGCTFSGIRGSSATGEPAIHFYDDASNTTVTNNFVLNCDRAIGFGGKPAAITPVITTQPISVTVTAGQPATFSVTAGGTPAPTYQWYKNGTQIDLACSDSYTLASPTASDSGAKFKVVVTNSAGQVASSEVTLTVTAAPTGTTYYLDATNGADTNDGSQAHPWQTFKKALASVQAGDTVLMNSGNYGTLIAGRTMDVNLNYGSPWALPKNEFANWVTFKAATGQVPHANDVNFGTRNTTEKTSNNLSVAIPFSVKGNCDVYIRLDGLTIDDGIWVYGCRYLQFLNCTINRIGALTGSVDNIDNKQGVEIVNGRFITLQGCDITHCSIGIAAATYDFQILNNEIHDNSHDGIRVWGGDNWLVEGNKIHDLDDGVSDSDGVDWNRHTDGMQIWTLFDVTNNVTIRRNLFYHLESMGIIHMATEIPGKDFTNWTYEDNIFGPVGGYCIHLGVTVKGRFIWRHNTIVYAENDTWTSLYPTDQATGQPRTMTNGSQRYLCMWPDCPNEAYVYNNIFADNSQPPNYPGSANNFIGHNLYHATPGNALFRGEFVSATPPHEAIAGNLNDYITTTGHLPGTLTSASAAIDVGTRIGTDLVTPLPNPLNVDFNNQPRDNRPDLGALEVQGRSPAAESYSFVTAPAHPLHFVDNFEDGRLEALDPTLNTSDTTGLTWTMPDSWENFRTLNNYGNLVLSSVFNFSQGLVTTTKIFRNISFNFDYNLLFPQCGAVVLYQDADNFTYIDFGGYKLVRRIAGVETVLVSDLTTLMPKGTTTLPSSGRVTIAIASSSSKVTLTFSVGGKQYWTKDLDATVQTGAVGFYRTLTNPDNNGTAHNSWDRIDYDNVQIDLVSTSDLVGDLAIN